MNIFRFKHYSEVTRSFGRKLNDSSSGEGSDYNHYGILMPVGSSPNDVSSALDLISKKLQCNSKSKLPQAVVVIEEKKENGLKLEVTKSSLKQAKAATDTTNKQNMSSGFIYL